LEKTPARNALHRDLELRVLRRDAQRIIAAHVLAANVGLEREVLTGAEGEGAAQFLRHVEPDRLGVRGLGTISAMRNMWKLADILISHVLRRRPERCGTSSTAPAFAGAQSASMAFEKVERLGAGAAAPQCLAGRGAEAANLFGVGAVALRAVDGARAGRHRRRDAVGVQLLAPLRGDPVGGPGGERVVSIRVCAKPASSSAVRTIV
jgi:hypothetical protein